MSRVICIYKYIAVMCLIALSWWPELCGSLDGGQAEFRVSGGKRARLGDVPYQISMRRRATRSDNYRRKVNLARYRSSTTRTTQPPYYNTMCGGVLISTKRILSAAHCFIQNPDCCDKCCGRTQGMISLRNLYAVAGALNNRDLYHRDDQSSEQWRKIAYVSVPSYYKFPIADIAVVTIKGSFRKSYAVMPVEYASLHADYGSMSCTVSGYGNQPPSHASNLMTAELTLIPSKECSLLHHRSMDNFICTRSDVAKLWKRDFGGPLVCDLLGTKKLVGIACGTRKQGTFFTRVSSFRKFIKNPASINSFTVEYPYFCIILIKILVL